jgi:predicted RNase H-related nuclease YkuK (DUF458 family)
LKGFIGYSYKDYELLVGGNSFNKNLTNFMIVVGIIF